MEEYKIYRYDKLIATFYDLLMAYWFIDKYFNETGIRLERK
jgi:hypothetical protein